MVKSIQVHKKVLSVLLAAVLLLGVTVPVGGVADWIRRDRGWDDKDVIRYVSVGDSMTNGYGFCGYLQDEHDAFFNESGETEYDFFRGQGVYGEGSYALQFEDWLRETTGAEVEHTKLALSAQRAEEVLYYLGGRDQPPADGYLTKSWAYAWVNGDFVEGTSSGLESYYKYKYDTQNPAGMAMIEAQERQMRAYYGESLKNADIISLAFGNAAFNAFFMDRVLRVLGALPTDLSMYEADRRRLQAGMLLHFTTESPAEQAELTRTFAALRDGAAPVKRTGVTAGHWRRGIE